MLRKLELLALGGLCLFVALLVSFAPGRQFVVNLLPAQASSLASQPNPAAG